MSTAPDGLTAWLRAGSSTTPSAQPGVRPAEVTADKAPAYLRVRAAFDQLALAI